MGMVSYLATTVTDPNQLITPLGETATFPESMASAYERYARDIDQFCVLVDAAPNSARLLDSIRSKDIPAARRMSLLKLFRRCVAPVLDTETTKKLKVPTQSLVAAYGETFKKLSLLKEQLSALDVQGRSALAVLISEYDKRGRSGYELTERFFSWFEAEYSSMMSIDGPRGAGPDIELSNVFPNFQHSFPCDFVIRENATKRPLAVGLVRYDSTRGGAQADDRTGGNSNKVALAREFAREQGQPFRLIFVSDGPGLAHVDIWREACSLDDAWDGNVRVTTLKLAPLRIDPEWLLGV
jgi:hypothetical protein